MGQLPSLLAPQGFVPASPLRHHGGRALLVLDGVTDGTQQLLLLLTAQGFEVAVERGAAAALSRWRAEPDLGLFCTGGAGGSADDAAPDGLAEVGAALLLLLPAGCTAPAWSWASGALAVQQPLRPSDLAHIGWRLRRPPPRHRPR